MAEKIGRLGYVGLQIEEVSGVAEGAPDIFIPFTENSLRGHHEPLFDNASHASRVRDYKSVQGKKWGEGSVAMYLDSVNSGYLMKMALGQETLNTLSASPPVHDHHMYPTVSGNAAKTATLWDYKGVDVEQYAGMAVDVAEVEITTDGIAIINCSMMGKHPSTVTAPTLTTVSGTLYTWKDMNVKFGDTVVAAELASATKLTNMTFQVANNIEFNYKSGSNEPDTITTKQLEVTGNYTLFFENATDRDKYYNLTKKSMVVSLTGAGLGTGGYSELLKFVFKRLTIEDMEYDTGLDDLYAITCNFRAEWDQDQAGYAEATYRNQKSTTYDYL